MGIRCVIYLDDILLLASSPEAARKNTQLTLDLFRYIGLLVKPSKVEAVPAQQIEFLGLQVDSVKMMLTVPLDEIKKLQKQIRQTIDLQFSRQLTRRQLAGVIGKVTAMAGAVETAQVTYLASHSRTEQAQIDTVGQIYRDLIGAGSIRTPVVADSTVELEWQDSHSSDTHLGGHNRCSQEWLGGLVAACRSTGSS